MATVGEGAFGPGVTWVIEVGGTDEEFSTILTVRQGELVLSSSGMAGPKLYDGDLVNASYGVTDDQPCIEVLRADPAVDRVLITTDQGNEVEADLTETRPVYGLRFGAAQLPAGGLPVELRAESLGAVVYREKQVGLSGLDPRSFGGDGLLYRVNPDQ